MINEQIQFDKRCHVFYGLSITELLQMVYNEFIGEPDTPKTRYDLKNRLSYALDINNITGLIPYVEDDNNGNLIVDFIPRNELYKSNG